MLVTYILTAARHTIKIVFKVFHSPFTQGSIIKQKEDGKMRSGLKFHRVHFGATLFFPLTFLR